MSITSIVEQMSEKTADHYQVPSRDQLDQAKQFFTQLLQSATQNIATAKQQAAALGFTLQEWNQYILLREPIDKRRGLGAFAINPKAKLPILWQAPHRYFDEGTGVIAMKWFEATDAWGLALNNVHRYKMASDNKKADLAHRDESYMMELSLAFAQRHPEGRIIQVHGFDQTDRKRSQKELNVILSQGNERPDRWMKNLRNCLSRVTPGVKLYPEDIQELGATTNNIRRKLEMAGFSGFVHVELAKPLRKQLTSEKPLRDAFAACFTGNS